LIHSLAGSKARPLSTKERQTLLVVIRTLFPHDNFDEIVYSKAVNALDSRARRDEGVLQLLSQGLNVLESSVRGTFAEAGTSARIKLLKGV
jgi:hypothetical protein